VIFASGLTLANCIISMLMGLGMGLIYVEYHKVFQVIERLGALYIIYLGIKIIRSKPSNGSEDSKEEVAKSSLGFKDGFLLQFLNVKVLPILTMMYSQFIDGDASTVNEVLFLSGLIVTVSALNYLLWAYLGIALSRKKGRVARWIEQYGFGLLLSLVGAVLLFN